jgi:hypothetical protein
MDEREVMDAGEGPTSLGDLPTEVRAAIVGLLPPATVGACYAVSRLFWVLSDAGLEALADARAADGGSAGCPCGQGGVDRPIDPTRGPLWDEPLERPAHAWRCLPRALCAAAFDGRVGLMRALYRRAWRMWFGSERWACCVRPADGVPVDIEPCHEGVRFIDWLFGAPFGEGGMLACLETCRNADMVDAAPWLVRARGGELRIGNRSMRAFEAAVANARVDAALWIARMGGARDRWSRVRHVVAEAPTIRAPTAGDDDGRGDPDDRTDVPALFALWGAVPDAAGACLMRAVMGGDARLRRIVERHGFPRGVIERAWVTMVIREAARGPDADADLTWWVRANGSALVESSITRTHLVTRLFGRACPDALECLLALHREETQRTVARLVPDAVSLFLRADAPASVPADRLVRFLDLADRLAGEYGIAPPAADCTSLGEALRWGRTDIIDVVFRRWAPCAQCAAGLFMHRIGVLDAERAERLMPQDAGPRCPRGRALGARRYGEEMERNRRCRAVALPALARGMVRLCDLAPHLAVPDAAPAAVRMGRVDVLDRLGRMWRSIAPPVGTPPNARAPPANGGGDAEPKKGEDTPASRWREAINDIASGAIVDACLHGHVDVVDALLDLDPASPWSDVTARWHGAHRLAVLAEAAAGGGHLGLVRRLSARIGPEPSERLAGSVEESIARGHHEVALWLLAHRPEGAGAGAWACAASQGRLEVICALADADPRRGRGRAADRPASPAPRLLSVAALAAAHGHLECARFAFALHSDGDGGNDAAGVSRPPPSSSFAPGTRCSPPPAKRRRRARAQPAAGAATLAAMAPSYVEDAIARADAEALAWASETYRISWKDVHVARALRKAAEADVVPAARWCLACPVLLAAREGARREAEEALLAAISRGRPDRAVGALGALADAGKMNAHDLGQRIAAALCARPVPFLRAAADLAFRCATEDLMMAAAAVAGRLDIVEWMVDERGCKDVRALRAALSVTKDTAIERWIRERLGVPPSDAARALALVRCVPHRP